MLAVAALLKCQAELAAGNAEFSSAAKDIQIRLGKFELPEVNFFLETFAPSCGLTLDELLKP